MSEQAPRRASDDPELIRKAKIAEAEIMRDYFAKQEVERQAALPHVWDEEDALALYRDEQYGMFGE